MGKALDGSIGADIDASGLKTLHGAGKKASGVGIAHHCFGRTGDGANGFAEGIQFAANFQGRNIADTTASPMVAMPLRPALEATSKVLDVVACRPELKSTSERLPLSPVTVLSLGCRLGSGSGGNGGFSVNGDIDVLKTNACY
ncbi:MAG: hypothetical protein EBZ60_09370 [Betaproteobacteria bacterium]|nr:hypothetical protein [Betaproteobacteria bacterium]